MAEPAKGRTWQAPYRCTRANIPMLPRSVSHRKARGPTGHQRRPARGPPVANDRVPPQALAAEQAVLGSMLIEQAAIVKAQRILAPADFYRDAHRLVFEAVLALHKRGSSVDPLTLQTELHGRKQLAAVGGLKCLFDLQQATPTAANVEHYADLVLRAAYQRRLAFAGQQVLDLGYGDPANLEGDLAKARELMAAATNCRRLTGIRGPGSPLRNGTWLDAQSFAPLSYIVDGIVPEGYSLLVGPPKLGKSWFILAVALAVASGGVALGGIRVEQRGVLYLALEDGHRRLQDRCRILLPGMGRGSIPASFEFTTQVEPGALVPTVRAWLDGQDTPGLVIVDTLGRVTPPLKKGDLITDRDYAFGAELKRVVDEYPGAALVAVHHERKAQSEDFITSVGGSYGVTAAADTILVLRRQRHEKTGSLQVSGRDVHEGQYAVTFSDAIWSLEGGSLAAAAGAAAQARATRGLSDDMAAVIAFVGKSPEGVTATQVADGVGLAIATARQYLRRAEGAGRLSRSQRGVYTPCRNCHVVTSDDPTTQSYTTTQVTQGHGSDDEPDPFDDDSEEV